MKRNKRRLPLPQQEFGFSPDTFNLFAEVSLDGDRIAVDCGADIVIGHHPHVVQPFEIYRGRPIFYSVGNFTFGSSNSRGESLLLGVRFEKTQTIIEIYPAYVKNRDPRVHYQPKILRGAAAERGLRMLASISGDSGVRLQIKDGCGLLTLLNSDKP